MFYLSILNSTKGKGAVSISCGYFLIHFLIPSVHDHALWQKTSFKPLQGKLYQKYPREQGMFIVFSVLCQLHFLLFKSPILGQDLNREFHAQGFLNKLCLTELSAFANVMISLLD